MSTSNLESILLSSYKDSIIRKYFPQDSLSVKPWEKILSTIMEVFGKSDMDIVDVMSNYEYHDTDEPMKEIVEFILGSIISEFHPGDLWKNIVRIEAVKSHTPYKTVVKYVLRVSSKQDQLNSCTPEWVWKNGEEVSEFMSSANKSYENLIKHFEGKQTDSYDCCCC